MAKYHAPNKLLALTALITCVACASPPRLSALAEGQREGGLIEGPVTGMSPATGTNAATGTGPAANAATHRAHRAHRAHRTLWTPRQTKAPPR